MRTVPHVNELLVQTILKVGKNAKYRASMIQLSIDFPIDIHKGLAPNL